MKRTQAAGGDLRLLPFLALSLFLLPPLAGQEVFSYVDANGVKIFTNRGGDRSSLQQAASRPRPSHSPSLPHSARYDGLIRQIAGDYGEDEQLVKAIIRVESAFDPRAVSPKNCKGLMQLHPDTAKRFGVRDIFDPAENIEGGVKYLQHLRRNFDDLELVLAAYNAGENAVLRHDGIPPYRETRDYVKKVLAFYAPHGPEKSRLERRRIYRVVLPDGRVLLTNTPSSEVKSKARGKRPRNSRAIEVDLTGGG